MVETILMAASDARDPAEAVGRIIGALLIPGLGLLLLILGLRQRGRSRRTSTPPAYPGYPPYPPYPPYPGAPYPPMAPPPAHPSRGTALIAVGSVLLAFGVLGGVAAVALGVGTSRGLSVGECISDAEYAAENINAKAIDCNRKDALYELASRGDGSAKCADGERDNSTSYALLVSEARTYCFAINVQEGSCYHVEASKNLFTPVSCTSSKATVKVDRRVDGSTDATECATGTKDVAIPEPPRLYCLAPP